MRAVQDMHDLHTTRPWIFVFAALVCVLVTQSRTTPNIWQWKHQRDA